MSLSESRFQTLADSYLEDLFDTLDDALGDVADVDLQDGILNVELDQGGTYIINKHAPNCQIWLSSPKSGASHYDYDEAAETWQSTRSDDTLSAVLSRELSQLTGSRINL